MTRLLPAWLQPWRCPGCGSRHTPFYDRCPYTGIPKDQR